MHGAVLFSNEWSQACLTLTAWCSVSQWHLKGSRKIEFSKVQFLIKEAKLVDALSKSIPELRHEVHAARKNKKLAASNTPLLQVKEKAQLEIMSKENKHSVRSEKKFQPVIEESWQLSQTLRAMKGN